MPFQEDAVRWFEQLPVRRGTLVMSPGSGKTTVALAIAQRTAQPGQGLVVAPSAVALQWADRAAEVGISAAVLNRRTMPNLIRARNEAAHGRPPDRVHLWIVSDRFLADPSFASALHEIPWSIVIVDEAHRLEGGVVATAAAQSVLYLTATPRQGSSVPGFLSTYSPEVTPDVTSRLREVKIGVEPTPPESEWLRLVENWEDPGTADLGSFVRTIIADHCRAGVMPGLEAIERHLARVASVEAPVGKELTPTDRDALHQILSIGYELDLPDSRSKRLVDEVEQLRGRAVLVSMTVGHLHYLADLLRERGVTPILVTGAMDPAERHAILGSDPEPVAPLLLSEATSSSWAMSNRDVLVHADVPSEPRRRRRLAEFLESDPNPRALKAYSIEWGHGPPREPANVNEGS